MIKLTSQQEAFVKEIIKGTNQRQAFLIAYPNSKNWKIENVDSKASNLAVNVKVKARIEELRAPLQKKFEYSMEECFKKFLEIQALALENADTSKKDLNAAIKCEENKAKLLGLYSPEKLELDGKVKTDIKVEVIKKVENRTQIELIKKIEE